MLSKKENIKYNSERISFSKKIKRKILLDVAKGKSATEALLDNGFNSIQSVSNDKKYAPKLIHKWKKELCRNREMLFTGSCEPNDEFLKEDISQLLSIVATME